MSVQQWCMRLVLLSDIHSQYDNVKVPNGDVLIHAGDIAGRSSERDLIVLNQWLGSLPHKYKIVSPGNHDTICEKNPSLSKSIITNANLLIHEEIEIEGKRFFCSPYTPAFFNWHFMYDRANGQNVWSQIPEGIDVLVTHGPPHGILDLTTQGVYAGCFDLRARVERIKPKVHVFGHIHEGYGTFRTPDTTFINASTCDVSYRPINSPIIFDI